MLEEDSNEKVRTKISKGYQVVVPSELRRRYEVSVGDQVLWEISNKGVSVKLHKKPSLSDIVALGRSGSKRPGSSVELKKRIQKGEL
ncbi:MAG: AbrB/MazE/SpoVT family DNA-binding domain-containing protein [Nitrososphaerales archaeon]